MAYTPTTWANGDTITAAGLNKMEQGIAAGSGGSVLIANYDNDTGTLDKTWQQIYDALNSGVPAFIKGNNDSEVFMLSIMSAGSNLDGYYVTDFMETGYIAEAADGYPVQ